MKMTLEIPKLIEKIDTSCFAFLQTIQLSH